MAFTEPTEGELQSASDVAAARQAFLSEPPEIYDNLIEEPEVDPAAQEAADEAAAIEELTKPPAAPEGEPSSPPPAPAPTGTPDPYAQFGGEEAVRNAYAVQEALRSEQGVRALIANGLVALGYDPQNIAAALDAATQQGAPEPQVTPGDPLAGLEDDDVVDVKTVRQIAQWAAQQAAEQAVAATAPQVQSVQDAVLASQQASVRNYTDTALIEALGQPPADPQELEAYRHQVDSIVQRGGQYYDPAHANDPSHIRQVVQRAHAELTAEKEAEFRAYIANKKRVRDSQPVNVGGGAGGEGPLPEPKNMTEAREQARKSGFFQ